MCKCQHISCMTSVGFPACSIQPHVGNLKVSLCCLSVQQSTFMCGILSIWGWATCDITAILVFF